MAPSGITSSRPAPRIVNMWSLLTVMHLRAQLYPLCEVTEDELESISRSINHIYVLSMHRSRFMYRISIHFTTLSTGPGAQDRTHLKCRSNEPVK